MLPASDHRARSHRIALDAASSVTAPLSAQ